MSNDPTLIEVAVSTIDKKQGSERQKQGYVNRLLAMLAGESADALQQRLSAGTALGILGDPWLHEMEMIEVPAGEFTMGSKKNRSSRRGTSQSHRP